jgi:hypothetical protein
VVIAGRAVFADAPKGKKPVPPIHSAAQRERATAGSTAAAGVQGQTVPLYMKAGSDVVALQFPVDRERDALDFVTAAFCHSGWPLLDEFSQDVGGALRGVPDTVRGQVQTTTALLQRGISQLRDAKAALRLQVAASLAEIERQAVRVLETRLSQSWNGAPDLAKQLLVLPLRDGRAQDPGIVLMTRRTGAGEAATRNAPTPLNVAAPAGARLRKLVDALAPAAATLATAAKREGLADARKAFHRVLDTAATVSPVAAGMKKDVDTAEAILKAANEVGALSADLAAVLGRYEDALAQWKQAQIPFTTGRRAAAAEFPVLHRFGYNDFVAASKEDDVALGARVFGKLAGVYSGANETRRKYVKADAGSQIQPRRPAAALLQALAGQDPPDDPVAFVMKEAANSVWAHAGLIQSAVEAMARGASAKGPFSILDGFDSAVSAQALAEGVRQETTSALIEGGVGLGFAAGVIALHFLAPPAVFIADAAFATHDLITSVQEFGGASIESRCTFDPALSLAEEPSLAWFLASQAFNLVTVG